MAKVFVLSFFRFQIKKKEQMEDELKPATASDPYKTPLSFFIHREQVLASCVEMNGKKKKTQMRETDTKSIVGGR